MIKLLYITNGITGVGGLERALFIKADLLIEEYGYEIHILSLNEQGLSPFYKFNPKIRFHNIRIRRPVLKYIWDYLSGVRKIVKEVKPDIISVCDDGLKGFFVPVYTKRPCPMIYERHVSKLISNIDNNWMNKIRTDITYRLMNIGGKLYDKFVIFTEQNKLEWKQIKTLQVIPNPLSFYPQKKALLINKKVILVGKLSYQKGQDILIDAWRIVAKKHPDWTLEIYGKKDSDNYYQHLIEQRGLENSIKLFDPVKNIDAKYLDASIYVMSSRFEGFGNVLVEAMACGLPCVSFDCPFGPGDIIADGKDGFLVENGNIGKLAEKIIFLIENEDKRMEMGRTAKENVKRFLPEKILFQWDNLFKQLLNEN
ncbi:MAG: glycosyltransferase family 4 protein [Prevotellaceae bacterium]|jgi:glycosyltransferase involved in cell wall biosynthesis|nr:glycosyltransferase family 4 protein [Prevotellaceae bacterium]